MMQQTSELTCTDCSVLNCYKREKTFPQFCLTTKLSQEEIDEVALIYKENSEASRLALAAAEIEGRYYGRLTRVEEIIHYAKAIGAQRIGIATCIGLMEEAKIFVKILKIKGLEPYGVICKIGASDKGDIGISEELKLQKGCHESMCNPILQAKLLNNYKTDFNIIVGLCVGHDSLFIKHSDAPVTTLIAKDRVLGHNPAAALYTSSFYYKRLLQEE